MITIRQRLHDLHINQWGLASSGASLVAIQLFCLLFAVPGVQAQTLTVLHQFTGKGDGEYPLVGVSRDLKGNLYGTTRQGGAFDMGTVFQVAGRGTETILHSFWGEDGLWPQGSLIRDKKGNLYGTAYDGGTRERGSCRHGCGVVFKLDPAGKETVLHAFTGKTDGGSPAGGLIRDAAGALYGTALAGGDSGCDYGTGCGVVFKLGIDGKETVLYAFAGKPDGAYPDSLIRDRMNNLYGTTPYGGTYDNGTVFKLDPTGKETVLYSFTGLTDGRLPVGPLVRDSSGNLYGVTMLAGDHSCYCGVVFKLDTAGKQTVLYTFTGKADGGYPDGGLVIDRQGNLYGATGYTYEGCSVNCGTIFKLDANGKETVLYTFTGGTDGMNPFGGVIMDKSGNFYGTTYQGGDSSCGHGYGCGVVFKLTP